MFSGPLHNFKLIAQGPEQAPSIVSKMTQIPAHRPGQHPQPNSAISKNGPGSHSQSCNKSVSLGPPVPIDQNSTKCTLGLDITLRQFEYTSYAGPHICLGRRCLSLMVRADPIPMAQESIGPGPGSSVSIRCFGGRLIKTLDNNSLQYVHMFSLRASYNVVRMHFLLT